MFDFKKRRGSQPAACLLPGDEGNSVQMLNIASNRGPEIKPLASNKKLNAVSMETIVDSLVTDKTEINSLLARALFTTYVTFTSSTCLFQVLYDRFLKANTKVINNNKSQIEHEKLFVTLITMWAENYPEDFTENLLSKMKSFNLNETIVNIKKHLEFQNNKMNKGLEELNTANSLPLFKYSTCLIKVPRKEFSEQLTLIDLKLFSSLNLRDCLASNAKSQISERPRTNSSDIRDPEIKATSSTKPWTNHFNGLVRKVIASILKASTVNEVDGVRMVEKWIDIALELRQMKNFSSLKAIVSALQSAPIHRLTSVWSLINKAKLDDFNNFANICNYSSNYKASRQLLLEEGTSMLSVNCNSEWNTKDKVSSFINSRKKTNYNIANSANKSENTCGTIPYLGMFLTDLVMIDSAHPDPDDKGLINFEKRRKEFDILTHIKILQTAATLYRIKKIQGFDDWYKNLPEIDEKEGYSISTDIFPDIQRLCFRRGSEMPTNLKWSESLTSTKSGDSTDTGSSLESDANGPMRLRCSSTNSLDCLDESGPDETSLAVRFYLHQKNGSYKTIRIRNDDRTRIVIKNVLTKFRSSASIDNYFIQQQIDNEKSITVPDNCNVFHALKRSSSAIPECLVLLKS